VRTDPQRKTDILVQVHVRIHAASCPHPSDSRVPAYDLNVLKSVFQEDMGGDESSRARTDDTYRFAPNFLDIDSWPRHGGKEGGELVFAED
jgi:hypothetical protein